MEKPRNTGGYGLRMQSRKAVAGVLFSLPCIVGLVWLFLVPMGLSLRMSLSNVLIEQNGLSYQFARLQNYATALFSDAYFNQYLVQSLVGLVNVPIILIFSFFAALLINQKFFGQKAARVVFFLPVVLSSAAMVSFNESDMLQQTMQSSGYKSISVSSFASFHLDTLLVQFGLPSSFVSFLASQTDQVIQLVLVSGVQIIVFLAALQSVSPSLYEAAYVEGASGWEKFWVVTLPLISPTILLCTLYTIIDSFTGSENEILTLINKQLDSMNYGLGSAMAWIYFLLISAILFLILLLSRKLVFQYDS